MKKKSLIQKESSIKTEKSVLYLRTFNKDRKQTANANLLLERQGALRKKTQARATTKLKTDLKVH